MGAILLIFGTQALTLSGVSVLIRHKAIDNRYHEAHSHLKHSDDLQRAKAVRNSKDRSVQFAGCADISP
jgi:hypothetical protein